MGTMKIAHNRIFFEDNGREELLLDFDDYLANRSQIPMHALDGGMTIPDLIAQVAGLHPQVSKGTGEEGYVSESLLIYILVIRELIKSPLRVRVLELGCTTGVLSCFLAYLLAEFNSSSSFCCVSDTVGNSSENQWLDRISRVTKLPNISMLAADYDATPLAEDFFHLVVINGMVSFPKPGAVIREAERLAQKDGFIICYCHEAPFLLESFRLWFPERREYVLSSNTCVLCAVCTRNTQAETREENQRWRREIEKCVRDAASLAEQEIVSARFRNLIKQIDENIKWAIERGELEGKVQLIHMKEKLLDLMCVKDDGMREFYRERLRRYCKDLTRVNT